MQPDELDDEIKARVQAQVAERAARRDRLRQVRRQFDQRRQAGVAKRNATKLARIARAEQGREAVMTVEQEMVAATYRDEDGKLFDQNGVHVVDTDDFDAVLNEIRDTVNSTSKYGLATTPSALDRLRSAQHVAYMAANLVHLSINQLSDKYRNEHGLDQVLKF